MMHFAKLLAVVTLFVLMADLLWLGVVMKGFYQQEIGPLMNRTASGLAPRWSAAIPVYFLIPAGVVLFVRPHLVGDASLWQALGWGAAFGVVLYGVYDLTNLAVLEKWTVKVAIADILWGIVLCGGSGVVMWFTDRRLNH